MTPQSFGTSQELLSSLSMQLMHLPFMERVLRQVALVQPAPKGQVYISRPGAFEDPFNNNYQIGAKVTYFDIAGRPEQFGQALRVTKLNEDIVERGLYVLGLELARGILAHEERKKPVPLLPVQSLSAQDREELCLPF